MNANLNEKVLANLEGVVKALEPFGLENFVFVGGAVVGLLITDNAAPEARFTQDIDVVTPLNTRAAFYKLEDDLRKAGFVNDTEVICRWHINAIVLDIMPKEPSILGFSNPWYDRMIEHATKLVLPSGEQIRIASAPYIIATKLEAFKSRGAEDYFYSHDLSDIIILLDGREELVDEIRGASEDVKTFIQKEFSRFLSLTDFHDGLPMHLLPDEISQQRTVIILQRMEEIIEGKV